ncbi:MAG: DUF4258 domain-containing protein [Ramlibacter sp.]|jgi:hypothetical protein
MGKSSERQLERHIRQSAADSSHVAWTVHAQVRMRQRRINKAMALEALRCGVITRPPEPGIARDGLTCRMERFVAGVQVAVVVHVEFPAPSLTVVTVIDVNGV